MQKLLEKYAAGGDKKRIAAVGCGEGSSHDSSDEQKSKTTRFTTTMASRGCVGNLILRVAGDGLLDATCCSINFLQFMQGDGNFPNFAGPTEQSLDFRMGRLVIPVLSMAGMRIAVSKFIQNIRFWSKSIVISLIKVVLFSLPSPTPPLAVVVDGEKRSKEEKEEDAPSSDRPLPQKRAVVVSRYRESIDWIPSSWRSFCFLYNKGGGEVLESESYHAFENIPNVGREGHTYLYYIVSNYDTLADVTYFTQAHPFDHW